MDGATGRSTCEVTTCPTALEASTVLSPVAEVDGGALSVPLPAADGDGTPTDDRRAATQPGAITGVLTVATWQASTHAAVRPVGEEATTRPQGMHDVGASLPSRRRRT